MTADDKYSLCNKENVQQPIQMELSKKQKNFPEFVASVLTYTANFEYFEKKDDPHSLCISEITDCKRFG